MKRVVSLIIAAVFCAGVLCACADSTAAPNVTDNEPVYTSAGDVSAADDSTEPADAGDELDVEDELDAGEIEYTPAKEIMPQTKIAYDGIESEFSACYTYGSDGYEKNAIWFDCDVTDVAIVPVTYNEETGDFATDGSRLFELENMPKGEAIILDIDVPDTFANIAITYRSNSIIYAYVIGYNGRDGGISFIPMEL